MNMHGAKPAFFTWSHVGLLREASRVLGPNMALGV